ncbi:MAG TPA: hypothetical protein VE967_19480 [Gemmatimonadaceae bacterium]|nr:hypothetical protein [Gemmatimonadaceae bacterium]
MVHTKIRGELTSFTLSSKGEALPGEYAEARSARRALQFCKHTLQMLEDTINVGEHRLITSVDLRCYSRLCHDCSMAKAREAFK